MINLLVAQLSFIVCFLCWKSLIAISKRFSVKLKPYSMQCQWYQAIDKSLVNSNNADNKLQMILVTQFYEYFDCY